MSTEVFIKSLPNEILIEALLCRLDAARGKLCRYSQNNNANGTVKTKTNRNQVSESIDSFKDKLTSIKLWNIKVDYTANNKCYTDVIKNKWSRLNKAISNLCNDIRDNIRADTYDDKLPNLLKELSDCHGLLDSVISTIKIHFRDSERIALIKNKYQEVYATVKNMSYQNQSGCHQLGNHNSRLKALGEQYRKLNDANRQWLTSILPHYQTRLSLFSSHPDNATEIKQGDTPPSQHHSNDNHDDNLLGEGWLRKNIPTISMDGC